MKEKNSMEDDPVAEIAGVENQANVDELRILIDFCVNLYNGLKNVEFEIKERG